MQSLLTAGAVLIYSICILLYPNAGRATTLEIAVENAAGPWSSKDGTGFANDVVRAAFEAVSIQVKLKVVPYARCKYLAKKGEVPACFSVSPELGLEETLLFSEAPLFVLEYDYYHSLKRPIKAKVPTELPPGTIVGVVNAYEYPDPESSEKLKKNGVVFEVAKDEDTNLKKLALGRIDIAIIDYNEVKTVEQMLEESGVSGKVGFAFRCGRLPGYVAFSKKNRLGEFASKKFNQGHRIIKGNGTLKNIKKRWVGRLTGSIPKT